MPPHGMDYVYVKFERNDMLYISDYIVQLSELSFETLLES